MKKTIAYLPKRVKAALARLATEGGVSESRPVRGAVVGLTPEGGGPRMLIDAWADVIPGPSRTRIL